MRPKLICCQVPFHHDLAALREYRVANAYDGVEWSLDGWRLMLPARPRARLLAAMREASPISSVHAPYTDLEIAHPDAEQSRAATRILSDYVEAAAELGAHHVNLHAGSYAPTPEEWSRDNLLRSLAHLMNLATRRGTAVVLENLRQGPTGEPEVLADVLQTSGIGLNFDLGHAHGGAWVQGGRGSVADFLGCLPGRVLSAHVYLSEMQDRHQAPTRLDDMAGALDALQDRGCDFWVLELHRRDGLEQTRAVVEEYLARRGVPAAP